MWIRAIYRIHSTKHIFLITSPRQTETRLESDIAKEDFVRILREKDRTESKEDQTWRVHTLPESDFLESVDSHLEICLKSSNQTFHSSTSMELLAINLTTSHACLSDSLSLSTPRGISRVSDEDIIEVVI